MRKKIIAGNWKMNMLKQEAENLIQGILNAYNLYQLSDKKEVIIAPPFPYLINCVNQLENIENIFVAAQNCSEHEQGAYTGEVSAKIIASTNTTHVIIGHSERRQYFNESDAILLQKIKQALQQQLTPIFCCGESLINREQNDYFTFIKAQLDNCIFLLDEIDFKKIIIAYEPIWAIGTGKTATPQQAQEIHAFIRNEIANRFNQETAQQTSILYGGSVNAKNASDLFACADIDGGLVGGASLKAEEFIEIIKAI